VEQLRASLEAAEAEVDQAEQKMSKMAASTKKGGGRASSLSDDGDDALAAVDAASELEAAVAEADQRFQEQLVRQYCRSLEIYCEMMFVLERVSFFCCFELVYWLDPSISVLGFSFTWAM